MNSRSHVASHLLGLKKGAAQYIQEQCSSWMIANRQSDERETKETKTLLFLRNSRFIIAARL